MGAAALGRERGASGGGRKGESAPPAKWAVHKPSRNPPFIWPTNAMNLVRRPDGRLIGQQKGSEQRANRQSGLEGCHQPGGSH